MTTVRLITIFVIVLSVVSCWIVDRAEINKFNIQSDPNIYSEETAATDDDVLGGDTTADSTEYTTDLPETTILEDIDNRNEEYQATNIPDGDVYQGKEQTIVAALRNGSNYLDGLRKAMARYRRDLENCTAFSTTIAPTTWLPENVSPFDGPGPTPCETIIANSDRVTRISELALWATTQLKERKFAEVKETAKEEEEKLLMKLAWFLDQLAQLTGYESKIKELNTRQGSDDAISASEAEIMEPVENGRIVTFPPKNLRKRSIRDPMTEIIQNYLKYKVWSSDNTANNNNYKIFDVKNGLATKRIQKRTIKLPAISWETLKPKHIVENVKRIRTTLKAFNARRVTAVNVNKSVIKRAADPRGYVAPKVPEDPMQDISYYVKNKLGTNIVPSQLQVHQVHENLERILDRENLQKVWFYGSNVTLGVDHLSNTVQRDSKDSHVTNVNVTRIH